MMQSSFKKAVFDRLIMSSLKETLDSVRETVSSVATKCLYIHSSEDIYIRVFEWIVSQKFGKKAKKTRYVKLGPGANSPKAIIPGHGKFSFWYKNIPVWVKVQKESGNNTRDSIFPHPESITFSISALNNAQILQDILTDIKNYKGKINE